MIAVTGASGHLGGNLVRALVERGERVRVLIYRDRRAMEGLEIETVRGDILDRDSLRRAFQGATTVCHSAARISIAGDRDGLVHRTNVEGTRNVIEACLACGVRRLVHFSSIHALSGEPKNKIIDESRRPALSPDEAAYDRSKALGEKEVARGVERGLHAVIINPTGIIGPHDYKPSRMGRVLLDICRRRLPALIDGGYNWVDVRDVVELALAAGKSGRAGEAYLASGEWISLRQIARWAAEFAGRGVIRPVVPIRLARLAAPLVAGWARITGARPLFTSEALRALDNHRHVSHAKATREFGYSPRPIRETIRDTLSWFRENGRLN